MKFDIKKMLIKAFWGFLTGLAAAILAAVGQAIVNYNIPDGSPEILHQLWIFMVPMINAKLVAAANWLKIKSQETTFQNP